MLEKFSLIRLNELPSAGHCSIAIVNIVYS
jgi:hypothetical protein